MSTKQVAPTVGWLDALRAVPTIGVRFTANFGSSAALLDSIEPVIRQWANADRDLQIKIAFPSATAVSVTLDNGFTFALNEKDVTAAYVYPDKVITDEDGVVEIVHEAENRTGQEIFNDLINYLSSIIPRLPDISHRSCARIGIVTAASFTQNSPPPGVKAFIDHLSSPWSSTLDAVQCQISSFTNSSDEFEDICHHSLKIDPSIRDPGGERTRQKYTRPTIQLDWQRYFKEPIKAPSQRYVDNINSCIIAANIYFEKFGLGDLAYA